MSTAHNLGEGKCDCDLFKGFISSIMFFLRTNCFLKNINVNIKSKIYFFLRQNKGLTINCVQSCV